MYGRNKFKYLGTKAQYTTEQSERESRHSLNINRTKTHYFFNIGNKKKTRIELDEFLQTLKSI